MRIKEDRTPAASWRSNFWNERTIEMNQSGLAHWMHQLGTGAALALLAASLPIAGFAAEAGAVGGPGEARPSYHIGARFEIGGTDIGYDYLRIDSASRRLYVAHGTRVEVLDADTGARLGQLSNVAGAHGVEIVDRVHLGYATSGLDRTVVVFDPRTLEVRGRIKYLGERPDALQYDPASKMLFVVNSGATGDVSVIDPASGAIVGTVELGGGKLEEITFDGAGRGFVADEEKSVIHVFDTATHKRLASWPLEPAEEPTGIAIDNRHHRLFAACGNGLLAIVDAVDGKVLGTATIGPEPDGAAFDSKSGRVFTSNRDGTLSVVGERTPGQFALQQTLVTAPGARTVAFDEKTGRLYLPSARFGKAPKPTPEKPEPRAPFIPESFSVIIVEP
jgi:DNA-binding beta-propeller fold protein YncE